MPATKPTTASSKLGPEITATSQTSRFHAETLTTLSREVSLRPRAWVKRDYNLHGLQIDLQQVNISVGNNDLIVDAHLRLKADVHYAVSAPEVPCHSIELMRSI